MDLVAIGALPLSALVISLFTFYATQQRAADRQYLDSLERRLEICEKQRAEQQIKIDNQQGAVELAHSRLQDALDRIIYLERKIIDKALMQ